MQINTSWMQQLPHIKYINVLIVLGTPSTFVNRVYVTCALNVVKTMKPISKQKIIMLCFTVRIFHTSQTILYESFKQGLFWTKEE